MGQRGAAAYWPGHASQSKIRARIDAIETLLGDCVELQVLLRDVQSDDAGRGIAASWMQRLGPQHVPRLVSAYMDLQRAAAGSTSA